LGALSHAPFMRMRAEAITEGSGGDVAVLESPSWLQLSENTAEETHMSLRESADDAAVVAHSDLPTPPQTRPEGLLGKETESAQHYAAVLRIVAEDRDRVWKQWHSLRNTCRLLREQNRDFEQEVLDDGHILLLALEMKIDVESENAEPNEAPPQNKYKQEIKKQQISQKKNYQAMTQNRRTADTVCSREKELEDKYKELMGQYRRVNLHLRWRLAHGCFHHGLAHYCVHVKKWCSKEDRNHPCVAEAALGSPGDDVDVNAVGIESANTLLQMDVVDDDTVDTIGAAQAAIGKAAWPADRSCFWYDDRKHCSVVKKWMRHPDVADAVLNRDAFIPHTIEIHLDSTNQ